MDLNPGSGSPGRGDSLQASVITRAETFPGEWGRYKAARRDGMQSAIVSRTSGRFQENMTMILIRLLAMCGAVPGRAAVAQAQAIDWAKVDAVMGRSATIAGDVQRYGFPRSDLQPSRDGVAIKPELGGWVAFAPMHNGAMVICCVGK